MVKHIASPTCPYCGWPGKNFSAVERHVRQRPICAAEQSKERNKLLGSKAHPALHRDQANSNRGLALPTESNVAGPSRQRSVSPSVSVEEVEDDDMPGKKSDPPRRNPNAILEDKRLDDEDIPETPPPRRNPSVVIKEVEDEDMPQAPRWGPHPYAKPTRASLFPEPYPDLTAGAAREFYDVDRNLPPAYTSILAEPDTFREAYWLDHLPICQDDEAKYFSLPRTHTWHWDSLKEFEQEIGRLPQVPPWFRETIIVNGDQENEILDLWKRDVIALIRYLLSDRRFIPHMRFAPERQYDSETRQNQIYSEMWSGKWWWRMQNILGRYATIVPIILSTDKSKMTVFSGNQKAWPVYLTIGNISHHIRRCPSERATLLVGYIPVSNLSNISDETERSEAEWQLFHTCMESILEPLKTFSRTGFNVLCADGGQMVAYLENREAWALLRAYMHDQWLVIDPRFKDTVEEDDDEDAGVEEGLADAADGLEAMQTSSRCLPFDPVLNPQTDQVRAFTTSTDSEGRVLRAGHFDVVLFSPQTSNTRLQGLHKLEAGRVRVIFALPPRHQSFSSEKLAYIERFTPFSARPSALSSLYTTQHASQRGHRSAIVVPLSQLRMTCHLAPRYHLLDPNFPVSSTTDLLSAHNTFYLNKYASPWLFSVLDYWEKQRH
ncbi:hypothetical protein RhiLY_11621 [Ceratobasidium sp. AG-Ba]|nr:hypothetical protein RhiLY_11621 [Ceratobasidium sp. AG-Ba]